MNFIECRKVDVKKYKILNINKSRKLFLGKLSTIVQPNCHERHTKYYIKKYN